MIRCLVVDDSTSFREALKDILRRSPDVEVVGEASDGAEAIEKAQALRPDVITMDVQMPGRDGLQAIQEIMARKPTPIVVISAASGDLQINFRALQLGAVEVLEKPAGDPAQRARQAEQIRQAVRAVAGLTLVTRHLRSTSRSLAGPKPSGPPRALGIVASTGGPAALARILSTLPADFPIPLLVVQHVAEGFGSGFASWLRSQSVLPVELAEHGARITPGKVLLAPTGKHLMVSLGRVRLDDGPPVRGHRPSGTALLASLAKEYGGRAAGLVLTGMGDDGAAGLKLLRDRGGLTIAQGAASVVVYGMPKVAAELGAAEHVLELEEIVPALKRLGAIDGGRRKRLLLVDDSETILQLERSLFESRFELTIARNGQEAVREVERAVPDGVLMDFSMPVMTGGEALKAIRALPQARNLPVIMVTSETEPALLQSCRDGGCQAIVPKPIDRRLLQDAVARFIES